MFSIYGRTSINEKNRKKLAVFLMMIFYKKKVSAPRAQRPNSERNLYGPP
jgi:hypothetical protein